MFVIDFWPVTVFNLTQQLLQLKQEALMLLNCKARMEAHSTVMQEVREETDIKEKKLCELWISVI